MQIKGDLKHFEHAFPGPVAPTLPGPVFFPPQTQHFDWFSRLQSGQTTSVWLGQKG